MACFHHHNWHVIIATSDMSLLSCLSSHGYHRHTIVFTLDMSSSSHQVYYYKYVKVFTLGISRLSHKKCHCRHSRHVVIFTSHMPWSPSKPGNHLYIRHVIVCISGSSSILCQAFYRVYIRRLIVLHWILCLVKH